MQKIYCFMENDDLKTDTPLAQFNSTCVPMRGETIIINGTRYVIMDVQHRLEDNLVSSNSGHEYLKHMYIHSVALILRD